MTTRRSFVGSILAAATPPGFVRAGVLMPIAPLIVMSHAEKVALLDELARFWDMQDESQWRVEQIERWTKGATPMTINRIKVGRSSGPGRGRPITVFGEP